MKSLQRNSVKWVTADTRIIRNCKTCAREVRAQTFIYLFYDDLRIVRVLQKSDTEERKTTTKKLLTRAIDKYFHKLPSVIKRPRTPKYPDKLEIVQLCSQFDRDSISKRCSVIGCPENFVVTVKSTESIVGCANDNDRSAIRGSKARCRIA